MKDVEFKLSRVCDKKSYLKADAENFLFLANVLLQEKFKISVKKNELNRKYGFDKVFWSVGDHALSGFRDKSIQVMGYGLVHTAMHRLVSRKYGDFYRHRPKITLLAEALAGAINAYFEFAQIGPRRRLGKINSEFVGMLDAHASIAGTPYRRQLLKYLNDPFSGFKAVAHAELSVSLIILGALKSKKRFSRREAVRIAKELDQVEAVVFTHHKDFANFVSFTFLNCGSNSSAADHAAFSDCLSQLRRAKSLTAFLSSFTRTKPAKLNRRRGLKEL